MYRAVPCQTILVLISCCALLAPVWGAEVVWTDGSRSEGKLAWNEGRLQIVPPAGQTRPLRDAQRIQWSTAPFPARVGKQQCQLISGERWFGQLLRLDEETVVFRPSWGNAVRLPRLSVAAVVQARGGDLLPFVGQEDEVCLKEGDQLFGQLLRADANTVTLRGRFGEQVFSWDELRGLRARPRSVPARSLSGQQVRVRLYTGHPRHDELIGVVRGWDERHLHLEHAWLGQLAIERQRLHELRWLGDGQRIAWDDWPHHLGQDVQADWQPPHPEGTTLRRTFTLSALSTAAVLRLTVSHLAGPRDSPRVAQALARGAGRTQVVLNGQVVDYLNRFVERSIADPRPIHVPLPAALLRVGENTLEIRLTADSVGRYPNCVVSDLVVEITS
ncbi:MAG: hypothetical protein ACK4RK_11365 [Gemmataceae bacterium]